MSTLPLLRARRSWLLAVTTAAVFALLVPGLSSASGPSGALTGYVTDASSHAAVAGARLTIEATYVPMTYQATTDGSGYYAIALPNDQYTVTVSAAAYYVNATSAGVGSGLPTWFNVTLQPAPARTAHVQGYVKDSVTSAPVAAGRVVLSTPYWYYGSGYSNGSALNASGFYRADLVPGTYQLSTDGVAGYVPYAYSYLYPTGGSVLWYNFTMLPANLVCWINGTVLNAVNSTPIAGASVTAVLGGQAVAAVASNATGRFSLHTPTGTLTLVADAVGYAPDTAYVYAYSPGSYTPSLYLVPLTSGVRGSVINGLTGGPVPNALVVVSPFWSTGYFDQVRTTATGSYAVSVPADDYDVAASAAGFTSWTTYAFLSTNDVAWVNITLWPVVATVKGYVRDGGTGLPLSGQYVYAYDARSGFSAASSTSSAGLYTLLLPPSPAISLRIVGAPPYVGAMVYLTSRPYATVWANITLGRTTAQLVANVTDAVTGLPITNAVVGASWTVGSSYAYTAASGLASLSVADGLTLTLSAWATGYYSWYAAHAAVHGSGTVAIALYPTLTANVTVEGYVRNAATNATMSSVIVRATGYGPNAPYSYTDGTGFYSFTTVPAPQTVSATYYYFRAGTASINPAGGSTVWVNLSLVPDTTAPVIANFTANPAVNVGPASPTAFSADVNESSLNRVQLSMLMQVSSNAGVGTFLDLGTLMDANVTVTPTSPGNYAVASSWDTRMTVAHLQDATWNTWWPATAYGAYQILVSGLWSNATYTTPSYAAALFDTRSGALLYLSTNYGVFGPQDQPTSTFTPRAIGIQVTLSTSTILANAVVSGPSFQPGTLTAAVSGAVPGGNYGALLEAWDSGYNYASAVTLFQVAADTVPPVAHAGPDQAVNQGAQVTFDGTASTDNVGIASYTWTFTDGAPQVLHGAVATYTFANAGTFTVTLTVADGAGNTASDTLVVTVRDTTPPSVSITAPANQANLSGSVSVTASASDNVAVVRVEFRADGSLLGTATSAPFTIALDTRTLANGNHTITATAYDAAGNNQTATARVSVYNVPGSGGILPGGLDVMTLGVFLIVAVAVVGIVALLLLRRRRPPQPAYPPQGFQPAEPPYGQVPPPGGPGSGSG